MSRPCPYGSMIDGGPRRQLLIPLLSIVIVVAIVVVCLLGKDDVPLVKAQGSWLVGFGNLIGHISQKTSWKQPSYDISLAGQNLTCLPEYSAAFRDIVVVMQFAVRLEELEPQLESLYSCFFPNIIRSVFFSSLYIHIQIIS